MTGQGEDILAFLDRVITAREEAARAVGFDTIETGDYLWGTKYLILRRGDESKAAPEMDTELAVHIALNDPRSVLRRCAADRKLLASHKPTEGIGFNPDDDDTPGAYGEIASACSSCGTVDEYAVRFPCHVVRLLAEGYGWTEGER